MKQFLCDMHTHSIFSKHAYSTISENARAAHECGLELLGTTDHFSSMVQSSTDLRDFQHFLNFPAIPKVYENTDLLCGVEADIVDLNGGFFGDDIVLSETIISTPDTSGETLRSRIFRMCDYVIASVHNNLFTRHASPEENANMYCQALEDPKVLILGHIGRSGVKFDLDRVLLHAKAHHCLIEINNATILSKGYSVCKGIAQRCAELRVPVTVSSDAHFCTEIGQFSQVYEMLQSISFPLDLVASLNKETFYEAMENANLDVP